MSKARRKQGKHGVPLTSLRLSLEEVIDMVKGRFSLQVRDDYSYERGLIQGSMGVGDRFVLQVVKVKDNHGYARNPFNQNYKSVRIRSAVDKGRLYMVEVEKFDPGESCVVARILGGDETVTPLPLKFYSPHLLSMYESGEEF